MTQLAALGAPPAPLAPVIFADAPVYHYDPVEIDHMISDGVMHCPVAVHENVITHQPECTCVRPGSPLPTGWRWATLADVIHVG